jgi:RNA polymerase sigma-70 factor (ECF subfamily)
MEEKIVDHLFRHQYGKMVSIITKIFGLEHLETIEDAVQDTFIKAIKAWRNQMPENPEAWLTAAAKNRVIDLLRSIKSENTRKSNYISGPATIQISELFLEGEIEDSQLRMIFTACHPILDPKEQIAFALKSIAGFNIKEIAKALMSKEETIKKRLQRARAKIATQDILFEIPIGKDIPPRLERVIEVVYLIFTEGFHSFDKDKVMRIALCGEALRLCKLLMQKQELASSKLYALFALLCFHSSRIESKFGDDDRIINLKDQNRSKWYLPLMVVGDKAMSKAMKNGDALSSFHYEAAIASVHLKAKRFEDTDWIAILRWYRALHQLHATSSNLLNIAIVQLQLDDFVSANASLSEIDINKLSQQAYLFYATKADYFIKQNDLPKGLENMDKAIEMAPHHSEVQFLSKRKKEYLKK